MHGAPARNGRASCRHRRLDGAGSRSGPPVSLTITYWPDETRANTFERWTLRCGPPPARFRARAPLAPARADDSRGVRAPPDRHAVQPDLRWSTEGGREGNGRGRPRLDVVQATERLRDRPLEPVFALAASRPPARRSLTTGSPARRPPAALSTLIAMAIAYTTDLAGVREEHLQGFFEGWPSPPTTGKTSRHPSAQLPVGDRPRGRRAHVVGFANAISDGVLSAFIPLLEVLPSHRNRGIGSELVRRLLDELGDLYSIDVVCDEELRPFYERFGMQPLLAMALAADDGPRQPDGRGLRSTPRSTGSAVSSRASSPSSSSRSTPAT